MLIRWLIEHGIIYLESVGRISYPTMTSFKSLHLELISSSFMFKTLVLKVFSTAGEGVMYWLLIGHSQSFLSNCLFYFLHGQSMSLLGLWLSICRVLCRSEFPLLVFVREN